VFFKEKDGGFDLKREAVLKVKRNKTPHNQTLEFILLLNLRGELQQLNIGKNYKRTN